MPGIKKCKLISLLGSILLAVSSNPAISISQTDIKSPSNGHADDEQILRGQAKDYVTAFSAGDAKALADMWTEDGTFINIEGREYKGRLAIEQFFESNFKRIGGPPIEISVDCFKFPADNVAIEEGISRVLQGRYSGIASRYTVVHVKKNNSWQMTNVTETDYISPSIDSLADLSWLIGNWTATSLKGDVVHFKTKWIANKNFIACEYKWNNSKEVDELQIIGWNPRIGKIVSWHFGANGGSGYGRWLKDEQSWVQTAKSLELNGTISSGINTIKR